MPKFLVTVTCQYIFEAKTLDNASYRCDAYLSGELHPIKDPMESFYIEGIEALDADEEAVEEVSHCGHCGAEKIVGQSCICFDTMVPMIQGGVKWVKSTV